MKDSKETSIIPFQRLILLTFGKFNPMVLPSPSCLGKFFQLSNEIPSTVRANLEGMRP